MVRVTHEGDAVTFVATRGPESTGGEGRRQARFREFRPSLVGGERSRTKAVAGFSRGKRAIG